MVDRLELQAAVEEVEPLGAVHVHCSPQHALGKGLGDAQVGSAHCKVTERDLDVEWRCDHVADHDKGKAAGCCRDALVDETVAEPSPEEDLTCNLEPSVPPCWSLARTEAKDEVFPAESVQVEAAHSEDRVV